MRAIGLCLLWIDFGKRSWFCSDGQELFRHSAGACVGDGRVAANECRCSADRFQGRNGSMSAGALPPASAQLCKYHVSHKRGLSFPKRNVANSENSMAAKRPLHNAPEPK